MPATKRLRNSHRETTADPSRAIKISGEILFAICLALAVSFYLLNASLADRRDRAQRKDERYRMYSEVIERLRSFRVKDPEFFENFAMSSFEPDYNEPEYEAKYPGLFSGIPLGRSRRSGEAPSERLGDLAHSAKNFGVHAAAVFGANTSQDRKVSQFHTLIADAFSQDAEAALFLNNEVVPRLVALDMPPERQRVAWWIASGSWGGAPTAYTGDGIGITFGKRFVEEPSNLDDLSHIYHLMLGSPDSISPDQELFTLWKESYADRQTGLNSSPQLGLPTVGLSIPVEAVVVAAAPILVLFQLLFLVHWERRQTKASLAAPEGFAFPLYGCPNDPLDGPVPKTLGEGVQRLVWTLFLIFPTALLTVGLLSRYDIISPLGDIGNPDREPTSLFTKEQWSRSDDFASFAIDWIMFACLILSVVVVHSIARSRREAKMSDKPRRRFEGLIAWLIAITIAVACVLITRLAFNAEFAKLSDPSDVHFKMQYLAAFGVFCSLSAGVAWQRRSRLLGLLSIAGLALFVIHFVPF